MSRTVTDILIDRFLKDVEEKESMPWQRPYECYNAFNYFTLNPYHGFNRIMLPFGEYMTANQINTYNKEHKEDFRFQKGIQWYPISFYKKDTYPCSVKDVAEALPEVDVFSKTGLLGFHGKYAYYHSKEDGTYTKVSSTLRYFDVADRIWFRNSKGELLPSKIDLGEIKVVKEEPLRVYNNYVENSGIKVDEEHIGVPCYIPSFDMVQLNPHTKDETTWFSTAFHEFAHSTGASHRLNRKGITYDGVKRGDKSVYAVEECIAEITAYLCCAECGVYEFKTSGTMEYENNLAYVQGWKKKVKDFGAEFLYICSQADKAFNFIMGTTGL